MRSNLIHKECSSDKQYKFQVYQEEKSCERYNDNHYADVFMRLDLKN